MDRTRFNRQLPNEGRQAITLQKKLADTKRHGQDNNHDQMAPPDLTDFMNDVFFGTKDVNDSKKSYNLAGGERRSLSGRNDEDDFDSSTRSISSRQTQEWLEEAKRMVASSPTRGCDSPARLVGSPRFAQGRFSVSSLDRRDPLSRSARRHRATDGTFSVEILSRTAKHTRTGSDTNLDTLPQEELPSSSPTSRVQNWVSNNIKIPNRPDPTTISPDPTPPSPGAPPLPPRQSMHRRSRFQTNRSGPLTHQISSPTNSPSISISKPNFKSTTSNNNSTTTVLDNQLLSPPKNLVESAHRRSISSSTCSLPQADVLSPPRNLVESAHRRSVSSSTCRTERSVKKGEVDDQRQVEEEVGDLKGQELNGFLKEQRIKIDKLLNGETNGKAKIVLSGPTNSTCSMVAAICYAWLLENRMRENKKVANGENLEFVIPVMNIRRGKMWNQRQAAWLFHHVGLDAASLLFSDEVDLETLMMAKQLSMLVVGEDILRTNREVRSGCTILADNYCEDAYDLLQTPILKKLLLAGILLDTQNLINSPKSSTNRDAEAVQLLSVTSTPNYRNTLFDQLMQDQRDDNFFKVLRHTYGTSPREISLDNGAPTENRISMKNDYHGVIIRPSNDRNDRNDAKEKKMSPVQGKPTMEATPKAPAKAPEESRGKNKNFFAKLFGFGSK